MLSINEWERRCGESAARSHQRRNDEHRRVALRLIGTAIVIGLLLIVMYT